MSGGVQLVFARLPLDPYELARLTTPERGRVYSDLGLDALQIGAVEEAVRLVRLGDYVKGRR